MSVNETTKSGYVRSISPVKNKVADSYKDDLFEQFSDLKSKLRSGQRSILGNSNRSTFRCRTSTEMFNVLIQDEANHSNNSLKIFSEGFYDNDFLLNDFMAECDLPQALLETQKNLQEVLRSVKKDEEISVSGIKKSKLKTPTSVNCK